MTRSKTLRLSTFVLSVLVASCAYQPETETPETPVVETPGGYGKYANPNTVEIVPEADRNWWQQFENTELVALMNELNTGNYAMQVARSRILQSRALLGQQLAANVPNVNGALDHTTSTGKDVSTSNKGNLGFTAAYEVDLWGSRDAANTEAVLGVNLAQEQLHSLALQLQSQLSQGYFEALAAYSRMVLAEENLKATENLFDLIKLRHALGSASQIDVDQQRNVLLLQQREHTQAQRDEAIRRRAVAVLLGRDNLDALAFDQKFVDVGLPKVDIVQPAGLLDSRPDIRIAELTLQRADTQLFQAKAKRWPSLTLSADANLVDVFSGGGDWAASLIGNLAGPIFDGGRIDNEIEFARIETSITQTEYRNTVLTAMQEALDSLTTLYYQRDVYQLALEELANNESLYKKAVLQYEFGAIDFLTLLVAQRSWIDARNNIIDAKLVYLTAIVNTFRAMGQSPVTDSIGGGSEGVAAR